MFVESIKDNNICSSLWFLSESFWEYEEDGAHIYNLIQLSYLQCILQWNTKKWIEQQIEEHPGWDFFCDSSRERQEVSFEQTYTGASCMGF